MKIEIDIPVDELSDGLLRRIYDALERECRDYERENPDRVMWVFGAGAKPIWREPEEPEFDDSIQYFEIAEREAYESDLLHRKVEGIRFAVRWPGNVGVQEGIATVFYKSEVSMGSLTYANSPPRAAYDQNGELWVRAGESWVKCDAVGDMVLEPAARGAA